MSIGVGAFLIGTAPALAICNPGRAKTFEGSRFNGVVCGGTGTSCTPTIYGYPTDFESTIAGYTPYVEFSAGGSVSTWPMLVYANSQACPKVGFVQAGNLELWHPWSELFWERSLCASGDPGPHEYNSNSGPPPGAHHVKVQWSPSGSAPNGTYALVVDTTTIASGTTDWYPNQTQAAVETHSINDQDYGGYNGPQFVNNFTTCDYYNRANHCYTPTNMTTMPAFTGNTPAWMQQFFSNSNKNDFNMYDTACAS